MLEPAGRPAVSGLGVLLLHPFRFTFISPVRPLDSMPATFASAPLVVQAEKLGQMLLWSSTLIISADPPVAQGNIETG